MRPLALVAGLLVGLLALGALGGVGDVAAGPQFNVSIDEERSHVEEGGSVAVLVAVENTGTSDGTQIITLDVAGQQRDSRTVSLSPGSGSPIELAWQTTDGDAGEYTATVSSDNDTVTTPVTVEEGKPFFVVSINEHNAPITAGDTLSVNVGVGNAGTLPDTQNITLTVGGTIRDTISVSLTGGSGAEYMLSWQTTDGDAGEYTATVSSDNTSESVPVTVESSDSDDSGDSGGSGASNMSTVDNLTDGNLVEVIAATYGSAMPLVFFVGIVCSLIILTIYINSRSLTLTAIVTMLSGGVVVEYLPPPVRVAGYALIVVGVAAVGASIYLGRERPIR